MKIRIIFENRFVLRPKHEHLFLSPLISNKKTKNKKDEPSLDLPRIHLFCAYSKTARTPK